ncbi:sigma-54 dependent transcriptional regulator [bacterium]|nr:sigma-54 dependent transcriptional regulator [bacterium]
MRHMLSVILKKEGYDTVSAHDAQAGLTLLEKDEFDFILSDIRMPGMDGTGLLKAVADKGVASPVIMMSAYGSMDSAMECMKLGAYDYISKPFKADEIVLVLRKAEERERLRRENRRLKEEAAREYDVSGIRTSDPVMDGVLGLVRKIADYSTSVLITGESGTGKELVARAIHYGGRRSGGPFVVVNCGALPGPLLESELFGHVKGAFTDAHRSKAGLFQEAEGGTIFLDEVGELPMELQVKLLRVLQEGEVRRVGDNRPVKVDARVVAATLRDLRQEISRGAFREDLFYRLNVIEVKLPPLRERQGDVPLLAEWFVEKYARKFIKPPKAISAGAMEALRRYPWPGNIRELENVIERAMILEETGTIRESSLPLLAGPEAPRNAGPSGLSIKKAQESMERELIRKALDQTGNNKTKAAMLLEISHRALLYKIKSYGL